MIRALRVAPIVLALVVVGPTPGFAASVAIGDNFFDPRDLTVTVGARVTWTNEGYERHTVTADNGSFDSGTLSPGQTYSRIFNQAGTFRYYCIFHWGEGMSGKIIATAPPPKPPPAPVPKKSPKPAAKKSTPTPRPTQTTSPTASPTATPAASPTSEASPSVSPSPTGSPEAAAGRPKGGGGRGWVALPIVLALGGAGYFVYRRFLSHA